METSRPVEGAPPPRSGPFRGAPWGVVLGRGLDLLVGLVVLWIALRLGEDHLRWVRLDVGAQLDEDSLYHVQRIVDEWRAYVLHPSPATAYPVGNYPPLVSWVTWARWWAGGMDAVGMREAQAVFTPILALGTAGMAWRAWGRGAAPPAAALSVAVPELWLERSNVMLALAVTGLLAAAYATVPLRFERLRPWRTVAAGVVTGLALLGHLSAVYFVVALGVGAVVEAMLAVRADRGRWRVALGRLSLWTASALAVCLPYYVRSMGVILHVLAEHDRKYSQAFTPVLADRLVFLARIKHGFFLDWYQVAVEVGLVVGLALAWRIPAARAYGITAVLGYLGIVSFPQAHDRYLLPLVPIFGVFALAPLGLLVQGARWRLAREGLAAALGLWVSGFGLAFSAGAFDRGAPPATIREVEGPKMLPPRSPADAIVASLLDGPARRPWSAPGPHGGPDCVEAMVHAIEDAERGRSGGVPRLLVVGPASTTAVFQAELVVRGVQVDMLERPVLQCDRPRCYVITTPGAGYDDRLTAAGYAPAHAPSEHSANLWTSQAPTL